jgi:hypothetical protein
MAFQQSTKSLFFMKKQRFITALWLLMGVFCSPIIWAQNVGIGTTTPSKQLEINGLKGLKVISTNTGVGTTDWISGNFGGTTGSRTVMGVLNGQATIGAHNNALDAWDTLNLNDIGRIRIPSLGHSEASRMLVTDARGVISSQPIPTLGDNLGNHTLTQNLNLRTHKLVGNGGTSGLLLAPNGNATFEGSLSVAGLSTFNTAHFGTMTVPNATFTTANITTANITGSQTFNSLAGVGSRMVVAQTNGVLATQAIPVSTIDNLGNHTASISLNLSKYALTGEGGTSGISIAADGKVGIKTAPTNNHLTVAATNAPKVVTASIRALDGSAVASANGFGISPNAAFDNSTFSFWHPGNSSPSPWWIGFDYGLNNEKIITDYVVEYSGISAFHTTCTAQLQGSTDFYNWTNIGTEQTTTLPSGGSGNIIATVTNTTPYRYYRALVACSVSGNLTAPSITELVLNSTNESIGSIPAAFVVNTEGQAGIGTNTPTANLDVTGTLRLRHGAAANSILVSDANGNATWSSNLNANITGNLSGNINGGTTGNFPLNDFYLSNDGSSNGLRVDNSGNVAIGTTPNATNKIEVRGIGGLKATSSNTGSNTTDWIAINAGGSNVTAANTSSDRVVIGNVSGNAHIGGHNMALNAWTDVAINGGGSNTITVGAAANTAPPSLDNTGLNPVRMVVNGAMRQSFYSTAISVGANTHTTYTWTHNLGYGPIVMMSLDQSGGGNGYLDYCNVTTYNNNTNETVFVIRNMGSNPAAGTLRWILVW